MSKVLSFAGALAAGFIMCGCGESAHPAATVNGTDISMAAYTKQVSYKCAMTSSDLQGADICKGKDPTGLRHRLEKTALDNLIDEELVRQYAQKHGITLPQRDVDLQWKNVFDHRFRRNYPALKAYAKGLGLTPADIKDMVREDMLQQRVMYAVTRTMSVQVPATRLGRVVVGRPQEAASVQRALTRGVPFAVVARPLWKRYRTVCGEVTCGDLLWLPNAFVPSDQRQVVSASPNSFVGPFSLQGGLLYMLVEEHAPKYSLTSSQQYAMRQQLFAQWVQQQAHRADVHRYVAT